MWKTIEWDGHDVLLSRSNPATRQLRNRFAACVCVEARARACVRVCVCLSILLELPNEDRGDREMEVS